MTISVIIGGKEFKDVTQGFRHIERSFEEALDTATPLVRRALLKALQRVADKMRSLHSRPWSPGGSGAALFRRSGSGLGSIARSVKVTSGKDLGTIVGRIGASFPMSVHEKGATIRPKRAQYLAIPLPAALDNRGVPKRKGPRDWQDTFVARSRQGNLLIFQKRGTGIVPLYLLRKEVTIPPRLKLGETLRKDGLPFFERRAFEAIDKAFNKAFA